MENLESYKLIKKQAEPIISNRHLYVASIIKELFKPQQHKNLCEIGAGNFELATILAATYESIDAYETYPNNIQDKISNLKIYGNFSLYTNVSNYQLLLSICPYYYACDIYDETDTEKATEDLVTHILDVSMEKNINSFIVLSNTYSSSEVIKKIRVENRYKQISRDNIDLFYEKNGKTNTSNNQVLIYKKSKR